MSRHRPRHQRKNKGRGFGAKFTLFALLLLLVAGIGWTVYDQGWLASYLPDLSQFVSPSSTSVESSRTSSSSSSQSDLPAVSTNDWELILVNRDNRKEELNPQLTEIDGIQVDSRIAEKTRQFLEAARQVSPEQELNSGYRSVAAQKDLYDQTVAALEAAGMSHEEAETEVQKQVQLPGASEHQTGLAIDMSVPSGQSDDLAAQIAAIAPDYGFVLRYPDAKREITGIDFENWHYRYVGIESAKYMQQHNLVLEEYLQRLKENRQ